jgi:hypothetical protein
MVRYYGRARQRIGSVNTNQLGLKMSGCPSKIGKQGALVKYQSRRVQCNQKFCGPVYYQGQMWSWNQDNCLPAAPKNLSLAGGVGNINTPRFNCNSKCFSNGNIIKQLEEAYIILENYFNNNLPDYVLVLFGNRESLKADGILNVHLNDIIYLKNNTNYHKEVLNAITLFNSVKYKGIVNNVYMVHEIALIKTNLYVHLFHLYGKTLKLNSKKIVAMENNSKKSLTLSGSGIQFIVPKCDKCNTPTPCPTPQSGDNIVPTPQSGDNIVSINSFWGDLSKLCSNTNTQTNFNTGSKSSYFKAISYYSKNGFEYISVEPIKGIWTSNYKKKSTLTIKKLDGTQVLSISSSSHAFTFKLNHKSSIETGVLYNITVTIED